LGIRPPTQPKSHQNKTNHHISPNTPSNPQIQPNKPYPEQKTFPKQNSQVYTNQSTHDSNSLDPKNLQRVPSGVNGNSTQQLEDFVNHTRFGELKTNNKTQQFKKDQQIQSRNPQKLQYVQSHHPQLYSAYQERFSQRSSNQGVRSSHTIGTNLPASNKTHPDRSEGHKQQVVPKQYIQKAENQRECRFNKNKSDSVVRVELAPEVLNTADQQEAWK
jgi:hypothetical protein